MLSSCTSLNHSMREPNTRLNLNKSDFTLSDQVTAEATSVKIIGIDWQRLRNSNAGSVNKDGELFPSFFSIPVIGGLVIDRTANHSLFELMVNNPGYDVVLYPQYETKISRPILGIGFFKKVTTVKTTARLGKLTK